MEALKEVVRTQRRKLVVPMPVFPQRPGPEPCTSPHPQMPALLSIMIRMTSCAGSCVP